RLPRLRARLVAGLPVALLPQPAVDDAAAQLVRDLRRRLRRPPPRLDHLRPLRRPDRPEEDPHRLAAHHGHRHLPHRPAADRLDPGLGRSGSPVPRPLALLPRRRPRRRMVGRGPAGHRERPEGQTRHLGHVPQLGAPVGFIIANLLFVGLSEWTSPEAFLAWGWRIPFLLSALLVAVGLYVRLSLMETPAFQLVAQKQQISKAPIGRVFASSWKPLILGTFIMLATYVIFYFMTAFTLTYGTAPASPEQAQTAAEAAGKTFDPTGFVAGLGYSKSEFLTYLIIGVVFFGIF